MAIKVSTLLGHNTNISLDSAPALGGNLTTNGYAIENSGSPVTITGNQYPITPGSPGQVLTTNGAGVLSWQTSSISPTGVIPGTYGSASSVGVFTVNLNGQLTNAINAPIAITPAQAGLGNVTNQLQVINAGGSPSIRESVGAPSGPDSIGAIYIDQAITNGNSIYRSNGTTWDVIATRPNLYSEKVNGFVSPTAMALDSVAIGSGAETQASANNSLAIGMQALARIPYGVVQAGGRFSNNGDAQVGRYTLRATTINNAPQELFVNGLGSGLRLALPDNSTWTFKVTVTGHRTDLGDGHAGYTAAGVIYRGSGAATTNIQGSVQKTVLAESNPSWDINISADAVNGSLKISVTGENGKIIRWVALVETVEVTN